MTTTPTPVPTRRSLRRKLHRWELLHLRQHVEDLRAALDAAHAERDAALRRAEWAEDCAERWRDDTLAAIDAAGVMPGLTTAGHLVAVAA